MSEVEGVQTITYFPILSGGLVSPSLRYDLSHFYQWAHNVGLVSRVHLAGDHPVAFYPSHPAKLLSVDGSEGTMLEGLKQERGGQPCEVCVYLPKL